MSDSTKQQGLEPYKVYKNDDWVDLGLFYNKVNFVHLVFYMGKPWKNIFIDKIKVYELKSLNFTHK